MNSDEELINKIKQGDDFAFEEITKRYIKHIFNFVMQYVRIKDDAEDVVADTFYKTWKNIRKFKHGMKFKPWLFTIARNNALDYIKKRKAIPFTDMNTVNDDTDIDFSDTIVDDKPLPSELFASEELARELDELMSDLHPDHKTIMILHYQQELTFDEISEVIDKPMNTVKSWHRRSLAKIRSKMNAPKEASKSYKIK